jgi:hypothetical protein
MVKAVAPAFLVTHAGEDLALRAGESNSSVPQNGAGGRGMGKLGG